jgi:hypothetical protein
MHANEKKWVDLDTLDVTTDAWMLEDHAKIVRKAKYNLSRFLSIPDEDKNKYRYKLVERQCENAFPCEDIPGETPAVLLEEAQVDA